MRSLLAGGGPGHHASDLALLDRATLGHANRCLALHHLGLGRLGRALRLLDVLRLGCGRFSHVDGAATGNRTACGEQRDFRKGHPNRHKLCSLLHFSRATNPAAPRRMHAPIESKGQRKVKATIALTVFWPSRCGKCADRACEAASLSHYGTKAARSANQFSPIMVTCQQDRRNRIGRQGCPKAE